MNKKERRVLVNNTIMMYILSIAKLVIPLLSLPYLTRVLSVECYGCVSFVKSLMSYFQILIDFGFLLSATKDMIDALKKKKSQNKIIGNTLYAQLFLCGIAVIILAICTIFMDVLKGYVLFAFFYLLSKILSVFFFEYVFKAYEQMGKIAVRYVIMKLISLALTVIFVKGDGDIMLMPLFDSIGSLVVIVLVIFQLKQLNIKVDFNLKRIKEAWISLKSSFVYFVSSLATTVFTALNTLLIGMFLTTEDVAYWSVTMQVISAIQALYTPITNSVFPTMVKKRDLKIIHKIMILFMPLIIVGCVLIFFCGDWTISLVFTDSYLKSSTILKFLIPQIILSFPAMLYGWPCLGAIDKNKQTTFSTIFGAVIQVLGLVFLALINCFTLVGIAIVRCVSEFALCVFRMIVCYKNKNLFSLEFKAEKIDEIDKIDNSAKKDYN